MDRLSSIQSEYDEEKKADMWYIYKKFNHLLIPGADFYDGRVRLRGSTEDVSYVNIWRRAFRLLESEAYRSRLLPG